MDVGCGLTANESIRTTPVGAIPNAYGIDPIFSHCWGNMRPGRTIEGYAEDMPFKDEIFSTTLSFKGVGWYADKYFDPYWSIKEMIRVTRSNGLVAISIGSGGLVHVEYNLKRVKEEIGRLKEEKDTKGRISEVLDFSDRKTPQINLKLK